MGEERDVMRGTDREQPRHDQDDDGDTEKRAHRDLDPAEPSHSRHVDHERDEETAQRQRHPILGAQSSGRERDDVVGKGHGEKRQRPDVRDDLQPRPEERDPVSPERPGDVRVLSPRLPPQGSREKNRISHRSGQDRRSQHDVVQDDARPRERPRLPGDLEDPCPDQDPDQGRVGLERPQVPPKSGSLHRMWNFCFTTRPLTLRQRYQPETSFMGTNRRSSLR